MTKFVLYGGFNPESTDFEAPDFVKEIMKDTSESARVLIVLFAKEPDRIPIAAERITKSFETNKWQQNIVVEVADRENFIEQIRNADVVYFAGGNSAKLLEALKQYESLEETLQGKTVAGESAGANVLCKFFYSPRSDTITEGLGIIPIKIIPHFKKEYSEKLAGVGEGMETLMLEELQFHVLYK